MGVCQGTYQRSAWTVKVTDHEFVGFTPVIAKQLVGHVDNSACPQIDVNILMTVVVPANAKAPVPLLMMFGRTGLPNPTQPPQEDMERINRALKTLLEKSDPELASIFAAYPGYSPLNALTPSFGFGAPRPPAGDPPTTAQLIADGWGYATIDPASIQADNGAGLTRGIIGLVSKGAARVSPTTGVLCGPGPGELRGGLDYLETEPAVDAKHVGIEGVSRYGKAALVTLAFEQRFAMGLIELVRRGWGQTEQAQLW